MKWHQVPAFNLGSLLDSPPQNGYSPICPEQITGKWVLGLSALNGLRLDLSEAKPAPLSEPSVDRFFLSPGDFLISRSNTLDKVGRIGVFRGGLDNCSYPDLMMRFRPNLQKVNPDYLEVCLKSEPVVKFIRQHATGTSGSMKKITQATVESIPVLLPPMNEQVGIAGISAVWDSAIDKTERLIAAKRLRNEGLSNRLLFGHARISQRITKTTRALHWFSAPSDWQVVEIGMVASEVSTLNGNDDNLPILSCTKHGGLVDSLKYFDKKVFSHDTSKSKIVRHGQFAYATNHIEEGSIGYQNLVPAGLVSPIYTVFQADAEQIDDSYFYKLLKTEKMRQIFAAQTNASVDRRGSLRWKEFARIHIPLPPLDEQREISSVLDEAKREVALLQTQLEALKTQKRGLMQKLLTGQWRLKITETEVC